MTFPLVATLVVLLLVLIGLTHEAIGAEIVMLSGLTVLVLLGVIKVDAALAGFANASVITIGALYVIGTGLKSTGALETISVWLFGKPKPGASLLRFIAPMSALSAFMNNTPQVAFFLPVFVQLAKRLRVSPSKMLIPLSYATILGGTCTLVGTSTNLVVDGILRKLPVDQGGGPLSMFELAPVGLVVTAIGLVYLVTIGARLLPDRQDLMEYIETHPREYAVEMIVRETCTLAGQTVRAAGLRDLPGLYLYRIERGGTTIAPVSPSDRMQVGDILCFSGVATTVVDLQKIRGLDPIEHRDGGELPGSTPAQGNSPSSATTVAAAPDGAANSALVSLDSLEGLPPAIPAVKAAPRQGRQLCEVVISSTSPLLQQSIKDSDFRTRYNAAIIAVHRSGEKLQHKIGQIVLRAGDTLLVDAGDDFVRRWRHSPDFILVSGVEDSAPVRHERAWVALTIFGLVMLGMSVASDSDRFSPMVVALAGAALMVIGRCVRSQEAHQSIEVSVVVLVAASLGLGQAMKESGAADWLAGGILAACSGTPAWVVMAVIYLLTMLLSELLSNNATAALMGMLAIEAAEQRGISARPLLIAVAVAASCAFATPIGYQTNLMVLNPGGYKFRDYIKVGLPLDFVCAAITIIVVPLVWKF